MQRKNERTKTNTAQTYLTICESNFSILEAADGEDVAVFKQPQAHGSEGVEL